MRDYCRAIEGLFHRDAEITKIAAMQKFKNNTWDRRAADWPAAAGRCAGDDVPDAEAAEERGVPGVWAERDDQGAD